MCPQEIKEKLKPFESIEELDEDYAKCDHDSIVELNKKLK